MTRRARGVRNAEVDDDMAAARSDSSSGDDGLMGGVQLWFRQCLLCGSEEERERKKGDELRSKIYSSKSFSLPKVLINTTHVFTVEVGIAATARPSLFTCTASKTGVCRRQPSPIYRLQRCSTNDEENPKDSSMNFSPA